MRMTEEDLLKAIGNADEDTIENSAPPEWNLNTRMQPTWTPQFHFRKIAELLAVVAVLLIILFMMCLILRMRTTNQRARYADPDERAAYDVLKEYLDACMISDRDKMLELSLIDEMAPVFCGESDEEQYTQELLKSESELVHYKVGKVRNIKSDYTDAELAEREYLELKYYTYYELGQHDTAKEYLKDHNGMVQYYTDVGQAYAFALTKQENDQADDMKTETFIEVVFWQGEWRVQPVSYTPPVISEEDEERLAKCRALYGAAEIPLD